MTKREEFNHHSFLPNKITNLKNVHLEEKRKDYARDGIPWGIPSITLLHNNIVIVPRGTRLGEKVMSGNRGKNQQFPETTFLLTTMPQGRGSGGAAAGQRRCCVKCESVSP